MPTYGYECINCHIGFETIQSIKDDPLTTCEACGGTLRKKVYPVGIAFKGSGFYVNDYGKSVVKTDTGESGTAKPEAKAPESVAADTAKPESAKAESPKADAPKAAVPATA
jgi:putative FmdB family regulatory protein